MIQARHEAQFDFSSTNGMRSRVTRTAWLANQLMNGLKFMLNIASRTWPHPLILNTIKNVSPYCIQCTYRCFPVPWNRLGILCRLSSSWGGGCCYIKAIKLHLDIGKIPQFHVCTFSCWFNWSAVVVVGDKLRPHKHLSPSFSPLHLH